MRRQRKWNLRTLSNCGEASKRRRERCPSSFPALQLCRYDGEGWTSNLFHLLDHVLMRGGQKLSKCEHNMTRHGAITAGDVSRYFQRDKSLAPMTGAAAMTSLEAAETNGKAGER